MKVFRPLAVSNVPYLFLSTCIKVNLDTMDFMMLNQLPTADELQEEQNQLCSGLSVMEIKD